MVTNYNYNVTSATTRVTIIVTCTCITCITKAINTVSLGYHLLLCFHLTQECLAWNATHVSIVKELTRIQHQQYQEVGRLRLLVVVIIAHRGRATTDFSSET